MTNQMIIQRMRRIATDLRQDKQQYATSHNVSIDAADEVCRAACSNLCDLIADELEDEDAYIMEQEKKKNENK